MLPHRTTLLSLLTSHLVQWHILPCFSVIFVQTMCYWSCDLALTWLLTWAWLLGAVCPTLPPFPSALGSTSEITINHSHAVLSHSTELAFFVLIFFPRVFRTLIGSLLLFPRQSQLGCLVAHKKIIYTNLSSNISAFFPRSVKFSINSKRSEAFTSFKYFIFSNYLQHGIPFPFHAFLTAFGLQLKQCPFTPLFYQSIALNMGPKDVKTDILLQIRLMLV